MKLVCGCTSCGEQKFQIRENVNKRIGMWENLVLFCISYKKVIYSFNTSPQVEKEKKKGMMDINLRYVAAVTSLGGDLTFLDHLLNIPIVYIPKLSQVSRGKMNT